MQLEAIILKITLNEMIERIHPLGTTSEAFSSICLFALMIYVENGYSYFSLSKGRGKTNSLNILN